MLRLGSFAAGLCLPVGHAFAMGQSSLLGIATLQGLCTDSKRDSGMEKLMWEAQKRTSAEELKLRSAEAVKH